MPEAPPRAKPSAIPAIKGSKSPPLATTIRSIPANVQSIVSEQSFIESLGTMTVAATVFALAARRVKLPAIVAYLLAGLFLGPITGVVELSESLRTISDAGIVLLLFLVGLELSFDKIRDLGKVALLAGTGQIVLTASGGFLITLALGFQGAQAVLLAAALTFSSTVVVVKLLEQQGEFDSLYGRIAVGILLVQDLAVIALLTFLSGWSPDAASDFGAMTVSLLKAFGGMTLLLILALLAARYWLPAPFAWASRSPETLFVWSLCWCFLVVLAAHGLHLSHESGAFLAGVSLAQLPYNHDLRRRVRPLMNFFIAVFFVSLGVNMNLDNVVALLPAALALSAFTLFLKPSFIAFVLARLNFGERTSFHAGNALAQISEFSFILAAMCARAELIDERVVSLIGLVGVISISVSSCFIVHNHGYFRWMQKVGLLRILRAPQTEEETASPVALRGHIIVIGANSLGRRIVEHLTAHDETVLALDTDPTKLRALPCRTMMGDAQNVDFLEVAGLPRDLLLVSCIGIEDVNNLLAYRCRTMKIPCAIHAIDLSMVDSLLEMDPTYLMLPKVDGIKLQNRRLKEMGFIES